MSYQSINPSTGIFIKEFENLSDTLLKEKLHNSKEQFYQWSKLPIEVRKKYILNLAEVIKKELEIHAQLISIEMGKPISQSRAELEKSIRLCKFYAENADEFLKPKMVGNNYIQYDPAGILFGIMPWNFPYWQVFRFLIPNLILGNTCLLKHASNVPQCALGIETLMKNAGFPEGVFYNLFIDYTQSERIIEDKMVCGVTLTGSELAGSKIASIAGKNIKKSVLELGGSDPFLVFKDADLDKVLDTAVLARMQNTGQSCIASKRFIIEKPLYNDFIDGFVRKISMLNVGDPLDEKNEIGPLARKYLLDELKQQVEKSVEMGAEILVGGKSIKSEGWFFEPTVLANIKKGMPAYHEEIFGPVASVFCCDSEEEMIEIANDTDFGLGASIWTQNIEKAKKVATLIQSGIITINGMVKSDPALPFGGVKKSGYGRELAEHGLYEFANVKTVIINP